MIKAKQLKKTLDEAGRIEFNLPEFSGQEVQIIISPIKQEPVVDAIQQADLLSHSGFAKTVLGDSAEDVWNDL